MAQVNANLGKNLNLITEKC